MAKNGQKMVEIFWGASHMIYNNILTFFVFQLFHLGTLQTMHLAKFKENSFKNRFREVKQKNVKNVVIYHI